MKSSAAIYLHVVSLLVLAIISTHAESLSKKGCRERCGDVIIPYPFGIGSRCSANSSFVVVCENFTTPILRSIDREILDISVGGSIVIKQHTPPIKCSVHYSTGHVPLSLWGSPFTISERYNTLAVVSCNTAVWLHVNKTTTLGGCAPLCVDSSTDKSCNGINCCHVAIPSRLKELEYTFKTLKDSSENISFCGHVFGVEKKWLENHKSYKGLVRDAFDKHIGFAPLILEWEFDELKNNSLGICTYSEDDCLSDPDIDRKDIEACVRGLIHVKDEYVSTIKYCSCNQGYGGNPYLPQGCVDIDECNTNKTHDPCAMMHLSCTNTNGSYICEDPNGKFKARLRIIFISIGSGLVTTILLLITWKSSRAIRKRIEAKCRREFFKKNGGLLLEQQLSATDNGLEMTKLYSSEELAIATAHYNEDRILGSGGFGKVFKGVLRDGRIVAVKKSLKVRKEDLEDFINEVIVLSQVNHRNVVKLLGCCLETEVPLFVFEFIPNGTLFQHIHHPSDDFSLTWKERVRIAKEVAASLAYLHSAASASIYHRDIKSENILLDDEYRAKVADFGTSRIVAIDQTHVTTRTLGTFGYMDPAYYYSGRFTEKSDVYSFGVVMAELLTGAKAAEGESSLVERFLACTEDRLFDILDASVKRESNMEEIIAFAELARRCIQLDRTSRPTMKTVAAELESIPKVKKSSYVESDSNDEVADSFSIEDEYDNFFRLRKNRGVARDLEVIEEEDEERCY